MSGTRGSDSSMPRVKGSTSSMSSAGSSSSSISSMKKNTSKVVNFQQILIHIDNQLTKEEKGKWIFLKGDVLPRCKHDHFRENFLDFFRAMQDLDKFTEENCEELFIDLEVLKHRKLLNEVRNMYG